MFSVINLKCKSYLYHYVFSIKSLFKQILGILAVLVLPLFSGLANASEDVVDVSAGAAHALVIKSDGRLWTFGSNSHGQLGHAIEDNNSGSSPQIDPIIVSGNDTWLQVSAGSDHSLAIQANNSLWGWGDNGSNQVNSNLIQTSYSTPNMIDNGSWLAVSAGNDYSLALKSDNTLWAWGANGSGQLGNNSTTNIATLAQIGSATWLSIAAASSHSAAIKSDNTLWTWGNNSNGQLGNNSNIDSLVPMQIGTDTWSKVVTGAYHSMAIRADGTLWAWGYNGLGVFGNGTTVDSLTPVQIGTDTWADIATTGSHVIAKRADNTLWTWGKNTSGQLAQGNNNDSTSPIQIGSATWAKIAAGTSYTLAIDSNDNLWAVGKNDTGQLGFGNLTQQNEVVFINVNIAFPYIDESFDVSLNGHWSKDYFDQAWLVSNGVLKIPYLDYYGNGDATMSYTGDFEAGAIDFSFNLIAYDYERLKFSIDGNEIFSVTGNFSNQSASNFFSGMPCLDAGSHTLTWTISATTSYNSPSASIDNISAKSSINGVCSRPIFSFADDELLILTPQNSAIAQDDQRIVDFLASFTANDPEDGELEIDYTLPFDFALGGTETITLEATDSDGNTVTQDIYIEVQRLEVGYLSEFIEMSTNAKNYSNYDSNDILVFDILLTDNNSNPEQCLASQVELIPLDNGDNYEVTVGCEYRVVTYFKDTDVNKYAKIFTLPEPYTFTTNYEGHRINYIQTISLNVTQFIFEISITDSWTDDNGNEHSTGSDVSVDISSNDSQCLEYQNKRVSFNSNSSRRSFPFDVTVGCEYDISLQVNGYRSAFNDFNVDVSEGQNYIGTYDHIINNITPTSNSIDFLFDGNVGVGVVDFFTFVNDFSEPESFISGAEFNIRDGNNVDLVYISQSNGRVDFKVPKNLFYDVVVSHVDYKTLSLPNSVDAGTTDINVQLNNHSLKRDFTPTFTSTPSLIVPEDSNYSYQVLVADANEEDTLTVSVTTKPDWLSFNEETNILAGTPRQIDVSATAYNVVLKVSDGNNSTEQSFKLTVTNTNDAPVFTSSPVTNAVEDSEYQYTLTTTDDDGDILEYSLSGPSWLSLSNNVLSGTPIQTDVNSSPAQVVVSVTDGTVSVSQSFAIAIANTNDNPVITSIPIITATEDSLYQYTLTATDDDGDSLTYSLSGPSWLSLSSNVLSGTPSQADVDAGAQQVVLSVLDDVNATAVTQTFNVTVENVNDDPVFTSTPVTEGAVGEVYNYIITTEDEDGDTVEYQLISNPQWLSIQGNLLSGTPLIVNDSENITIRALDNNGGSSEQSFNVKVILTNNPPKFISTPVLNAIEAELYQYTLAGSDEDDQTLTYTALELPEWLTLNDNILSGTPSQLHIGSNKVSLQVSDSIDVDSQSFFIDVVDNGVTALAITAPDDIIVEATAEFSQVNLGMPTIVDDIDINLVATSDNIGPFSVGSYMIIWSVTDSDNNVASAIQNLTVTDTTAPNLGIPTEQIVNASGFTTDITKKVNLIAFDLVDGEIAAVIDNESTMLSPGRHSITWSAMDSLGNRSSVNQSIVILPQAQLSGNYAIEADSELIIPINLTGIAADYPVTIMLEVSGSANSQAYQLAQSNIVINEGQQGDVYLTTSSDAFNAGDTLILTLTDANNAFIVEQTTAKIEFVSDNIAPQLTLTSVQNGEMRRQVFKDQGAVDLIANIVDVNSNDTHSIVWQTSIENVAFTSEEFSFDPSVLPEGLHKISATVIEKNTDDAFNAIYEITINVIASAPILDEVSDQDNDGIPDAQEGLADSDGDGIADYLDNNSNSSQLPINGNNDVMTTTAGLSLSIGDIAATATGVETSNANIGKENFERITGDLSLNGLTPVLPIIDFVISGLEQAGESASVIIPLPIEQSIPANALYLKYNEVKGWYSFVADDSNTIASAPRTENGQCPALDSDNYQPGLNIGDVCVMLTLTDGGGYDDDGKVNGQIADPAIIIANMPPSLSVVAPSMVDEESLVELQAIASDPEQNELTYSWQQTAGPAVIIENANAAIIHFTAPKVQADTHLSFTVTVSDGFSSVEQQLDISVIWTPLPLIISVEFDSTDVYEGTLLSIDASESSDPEGLEISYQWSTISGPEVTFISPNAAMTNFRAPQVMMDSSVTIRLTIRQGERNVEQDFQFSVKEIDIDELKDTPDGGIMSLWLLMLLLVCHLYGVAHLRLRSNGF